MRTTAFRTLSLPGCRRLATGLIGSSIAGLCLVLTSAAAAPTSARAAPVHQAAPCSTGGGALKSATVCRVMPASGPFVLPIPGTGASLIGTGTPDRAGKPIEIARVGRICTSLGGFGIRLITPRSAGLLPPLRWATGTLYARDPKSGVCGVVTSPALTAAPGTYQVVPGSPSGVSAMPRTGGGRGGAGGTALPWGLLLALLGAGLVLRSRVANP